MIENKFDCPVELWAKFDNEAKIKYNKAFAIFNSKVIYSKPNWEFTSVDVMAHNVVITMFMAGIL